MRREVWVSGRRGRLELYLLNHPQYVNALGLAIKLNEQVKQVQQVKT